MPRRSAGPTGFPDSDLALFARMGLPAPAEPELTQSKIQKYFLATKSNRSSFLLAIDGVGLIRSESNAILTQLSLPLVLQQPTVVRMVPGNRYPYLNYGVYDAFKTVAAVANAAAKLEKRGIAVLGQLIQMSEEDLRCYRFVNDETISDMKAHLATVKLGFGMRAPAWNRTFTSLGPAP